MCSVIRDALITARQTVRSVENISGHFPSRHGLRVLIERTNKNLHRVRIALQISTRRLPTTTTATTTATTSPILAANGYFNLDGRYMVLMT